MSVFMFACMCLYVPVRHTSWNQMWSKSSLHHLTSSWLSQKSLKKENAWEPEATIVNNAALLSLPRRKFIFWIVILLQEAPWMQQVGFVGLWSRKRLKKNLVQSEVPPVAFPKKHLHPQPWKPQNFLVKRCNLERTLNFKKRSDSFDFQGLHEFSDPICLHLDQGLYACQVSQGNTRRASVSVTSRSWMI